MLMCAGWVISGTRSALKGVEECFRDHSSIRHKSKRIYRVCREVGRRVEE